ncbi:MAG: putative DNA binding domain-containing protein [Candidatus Contendobacter sp.]|nr:putative DNA binding domain-containing protein [Candidatus Contendobacter sp.]
MKTWITKALELLRASLEPPKHELNELDWKTALSHDKKRLTEHLSALANQPGGGYLVFGVDNTGAPVGVDDKAVEFTVNQLANLGRAGLEPPLALDHAIEDYESVPLLFVHVPESAVKPVHLRGKGLEEAFIRSGGTTRKASRQEIGTMMLNSRTPRWEELHASSVLLPDTEFTAKLNIEPIFRMLERPLTTTQEDTLAWMASERFIVREPAGGGYVTNLGAIATARKLADFPDLSRKAVRVVVYDGLNKAKTKQEQEGTKGYAISFQGLIEFVMALLPQSEVIEKALRTKRTVYPEIALREIVANALIHQDFSVTGAGPLIEIFDDRIDVSNPGGLLPSKRLDRLIGTQPESRNEQLARAFRRYKICEERGSGLLKAGLQVELYGLPPIEFTAGPNHFKVTLYSPRTFAEMSAHERLEACYQHAVLRYYSDSAMTNTTLRERLKMPEKQRSMVSVLIQDAIDRHLVKSADPENKSKKFAQYVPFWA